MNEIALGAIPSSHDYRDAYFAAGLPTVAIPTTLHTDLGPILDQNKIPACVSHSIVYLMKLYWYRKLGRWIDLSPRYLDIRSEAPWIPIDGGRNPREVLKIAVNEGCCTTALLPNDTEFLTLGQYRNPAAITNAMRLEAAKYKIPGFIRIAIDPVSTANAIALYGAISSLYEVGNELWTPSWNDRDIDPLRTPKAVVGGHQMTPNGLAPNFNNIRNQWSIDWGNNGEAQYNATIWQPYTVEQWAVAAVPPNVVEFLRELPSPDSFAYQWNSNMGHGATGDDVKFLQVAYMILGLMGPVPADELGIWGPKTDVANAKYQASKKINPVPGSCGPLTRAALNAQFLV